MPTYQYACMNADCGNQFELVQSFSDPSASECPACEGPVRKVFSAVGVVFKGPGFYRTDSRTESRAGADKSSEKSNEKFSEKSSEKSSEKPAAKSTSTESTSSSSTSDSTPAPSTSASFSSSGGTPPAKAAASA